MTSIDPLHSHPSAPTSSPRDWPARTSDYDAAPPGAECLDAPAPIRCDHAGWQALRDGIPELVPAADLAAANATIAELRQTIREYEIWERLITAKYGIPREPKTAERRGGQ